MSSVPNLTPARLRFRRFCILLLQVLLKLLARREVIGKENIPAAGTYIVAGNHLWGLDPALIISELPTPPELLAARKILGWPLIGQFAHGYGVIPVDRRNSSTGHSALNAAVALLKHNRTLMIFPEGRESRTGQLEHGRSGIAYITHLSGVTTVVPVAITGTETTTANWRRLRRPRVTVTFGAPIQIPAIVDHKYDFEVGLRLVMTHIARLLPEHYRGVYRDAV